MKCWFVHFQQQLQLVTPASMTVNSKILNATISHYLAGKL